VLLCAIVEKRMSGVVTVNVIVDLSVSFSTDGGSFSCCTTQATRDNAAKIARAADLVVYTTDVHDKTSSEFTTNGGLFPPHHILGTRGGDAVPGSSPKPVPEVVEALASRKAMMCCPRHVYFASDESLKTGVPVLKADDLQKEFGAPLAPEDIAAAGAMLKTRGGDVSLLYSAKNCFNGVLEMPVTNCAAVNHVDGVPDKNFNAFTLLRSVYGLGKGLRFVVDGVVLSICVFQVASNVKQMFPDAIVQVVNAASTALPGEPVTGASWEAVVNAMFGQIGVEIVSMEDALKQ